MYSKHKMSKKSKMKRKKHTVVVKRKSNVAKNSNNIVIRIDNSKRKQSNSKRRKALSQPRVQEPVSIPVIRQYTDIGNYTNEILNRNNAILQEQKIKRDETEAKSTSRLGTATPATATVAIPIETKTPVKKPLLEPLSTRLGETPAEALFKRSLFRKMMTSPIEEEEDIDNESPTVKGLDLAEPSVLLKNIAPTARRKTNNFRGARPLDELTLKSIPDLQGLIKRSKNPAKIKAFQEAIDYKKGIINIRDGEKK